MLTRANRALVLAVSGALVAAGVAAALARLPAAADALWARGPGPWIPFLLSRVTGPLPFSLVEAGVAAWVALRLFQGARGAVALVRRRRGAAAALGAGARVVVRDLAAALALFYVLWGFGYACAPLEARLGWGVRGGPDDARLGDLAARMVAETNEAYVALHGTPDAGAPTSMPDPAALEAAVERAWQRVGAALELPGPAARRHGRAKRLVLSPALRRAGLSGFFSPFTGEANLNRSVPAVSYPQVVAHEKAHQRGINREDEANFLGWLAAASSDDPLARYAAAVFAQRQLLRPLLAVDEARARSLVAERVPGVQRDVDDLRDYWSVSTGRTGRIANRMNDAYLRGNRVADGVASYGRAAELLLAWAARSGGQLAPVPDDAPTASSAPRTLRASDSSVNGFCRNSASDTDTPYRTIASSL